MPELLHRPLKALDRAGRDVAVDVMTIQMLFAHGGTRIGTSGLAIPQHFFFYGEKIFHITYARRKRRMDLFSVHQAQIVPIGTRLRYG